MWKCRNTFVHPIVDGGLSLEAYAALQEDINAQLQLGTTRLPRDDHYLLEETLSSLNDKPIAERRAWLCTIKLARADAPTPSRQLQRVSKKRKPPDKKATDLPTSRYNLRPQHC